MTDRENTHRRRELIATAKDHHSQAMLMLGGACEMADTVGYDDFVPGIRWEDTLCPFADRELQLAYGRGYIRAGKDTKEQANYD